MVGRTDRWSFSRSDPPVRMAWTVSAAVSEEDLVPEDQAPAEGEEKDEQ